MKRSRQAGFTLLEVMIASVASMAVIAPAIAVMFNAFDWYAQIQSAIAINREARQVMDVIGNGAHMTVTGNDGRPEAYGIRGRQAPPSGTLRSNYTLQYQSNNFTVNGDSLASLTITCTAIGQPLPDCPSAGSSRTVAGWIGNDVSLSTNRSPANRTVEVTVTITDPFQAQRAVNSASATESYRTSFTLNRDMADP
jgi:prepilin-type N-terminal cleavage/methylation domain-containing protein